MILLRLSKIARTHRRENYNNYFVPIISYRLDEILKVWINTHTHTHTQNKNYKNLVKFFSVCSLSFHGTIKCIPDLPCKYWKCISFVEPCKYHNSWNRIDLLHISDLIMELYVINLRYNGYGTRSNQKGNAKNIRYHFLIIGRYLNLVKNQGKCLQQLEN
jgi:hypothetical protein